MWRFVSCLNNVITSNSRNRMLSVKFGQIWVWSCEERRRGERDREREERSDREKKRQGERSIAFGRTSQSPVCVRFFQSQKRRGLRVRLRLYFGPIKAEAPVSWDGDRHGANWCETEKEGVTFEGVKQARVTFQRRAKRRSCFFFFS